MDNETPTQQAAPQTDAVRAAAQRVVDAYAPDDELTGGGPYQARWDNVKALRAALATPPAPVEGVTVETDYSRFQEDRAKAFEWLLDALIADGAVTYERAGDLHKIRHVARATASPAERQSPPASMEVVQALTPLLAEWQGLPDSLMVELVLWDDDDCAGYDDIDEAPEDKRDPAISLGQLRRIAALSPTTEAQDTASHRGDEVESVARALCISGGFDPDEMMANDGPRWRYYETGASAAIAALRATPNTEDSDHAD